MCPAFGPRLCPKDQAAARGLVTLPLCLPNTSACARARCAAVPGRSQAGASQRAAYSPELGHGRQSAFRTRPSGRFLIPFPLLPTQSLRAAGLKTDSNFFRAFGISWAYNLSMLIWLIIIGIFAILAVAGYYQGAVRGVVSLLGLVLALFLAGPLSPSLRPLVPKVGLTNPAWPYIVPPVVVFLLIALVFLGVGFFVHYKVAKHLKNTSDDYSRARWDRLNRRLGACVGLIAAAIYSVLIGIGIYIFGYPAVQAASDDSPALIRFLSQARLDLHQTGLDRTLSSTDPMPENYYVAVDVLGLIYYNNTLQERISNYPPFLSLGLRQEFQDIANDVDLQSKLQQKGPAVDIINNPKVQAVIANPDIRDALRQIDLKDLIQYLKTGKSAKYDEEKILGRWKLDPSATLTLAKKKNPDMPAQQMAAMKRMLGVFLSNVNFMATPDNNKALLKVEVSDEAKRFIEAAKAAANPTPPPDAAAPAMDPRMAARYGRQMRPTAPTPPPVAAAAPAVPDFDFSSEGTWERNGDKYKLQLKDGKGKDHTGEATADDDRLLLVMDRQSFVFVR